ncbi:MAG: NADH-quinone oxidoreductase subunit L [Desulfonatronovibrionaceae bacterium]
MLPNIRILQKAVVMASAVLVTTGSVLAYLAGPMQYDPDLGPFLNSHLLVAVLDFLLLFVILYIGVRRRNHLITVLTGLQIVFLAVVELMPGPSMHSQPLFADEFSLMMLLVVSVVGSLICLYAVEYMRRHEEHLGLERSAQGRFFFFMLLFLGVMNGLVLSNNLLWLYFFWEVTTFCSFVLIGHDGTTEARQNSEKALWMNLLGGLALVLGLVIVRANDLPLELMALVNEPRAGVLLLPMALFCLAGFTKSAQVPFQNWLTGAMVAPTPVSALLHSSTMVNAGVYFILRLAPAFQDTLFASYVALFGAFTFIATSTLALSQTNGKKILAYSTIGNLGMVIACAGIDTPAAMSAGILLILFHALSKGLLFMCVGSIEQKIGSRNIEDMRGLFSIMPKTTIVTVIGMITMFLPPFGVLLSKWMAIEACSKQPLVVVMLALGSAFTVVFWARWAGLLLSSTFSEEEMKKEVQSWFVSIPLTALAALSVVTSLLVVGVYTRMVQPVVQKYYSEGIYLTGSGGLFNEIGAFAIYPVFFILVAGLIYAIRAASRIRERSYSAPYMSGIQLREGEQFGFNGPLGIFVPFKSGNYYLRDYIGEERILTGINIVGIGIIIILMAGVF